MVLRPGDEIRTTCTFRRPSKGSPVCYGDGTSDEMCFGFLTYFPLQKELLQPWCTSRRSLISCERTLPQFWDRPIQVRQLQARMRSWKLSSAMWVRRAANILEGSTIRLQKLAWLAWAQRVRVQMRFNARAARHLFWTRVKVGVQSAELAREWRTWWVCNQRSVRQLTIIEVYVTWGCSSGRKSILDTGLCAPADCGT